MHFLGRWEKRVRSTYVFNTVASLQDGANVQAFHQHMLCDAHLVYACTHSSQAQAHTHTCCKRVRGLVWGRAWGRGRVQGRQGAEGGESSQVLSNQTLVSISV